jgi:hypothetical protein
MRYQLLTARRTVAALRGSQSVSFEPAYTVRDVAVTAMGAQRTEAEPAPSSRKASPALCFLLGALGCSHASPGPVEQDCRVEASTQPLVVLTETTAFTPLFVLWVSTTPTEASWSATRTLLLSPGGPVPNAIGLRSMDQSPGNHRRVPLAPLS